MYNAFLGFSDLDHSAILRFMGYDRKTSERFWNMVLKKYLGTDDEALCKEVENKARVIGYTRLLRRYVRRTDEAGAKDHAEYYRKRLVEIIDQVDTLDF